MATYDTYKYIFKVGNKIVYSGITNNLSRRQSKLRAKPGWKKGNIESVGRRTSRAAALKWKREQ